MGRVGCLMGRLGPWLGSILGVWFVDMFGMMSRWAGQCSGGMIDVED